MKKLLAAVVMATVIAGSAQALENTVAPKVKDLGLVSAPKSGLIVGNSYSFYNCGVHSYLRQLTRESKQPWKARILTMSSAMLSWHNVKDYLTPDKEMDPYAKAHPMFDVVILQGMSSEPIDAKRQATFKKYVKQHGDTIRAAGAVPLLVATWAKQNKTENTSTLADETIKAGNDANMMVLPVGLAFAESLKIRPDLIMHQKDKSHPTAAGSYLYGAMLYSVLFKKSPEGMKALGECEKPLKPEDAKHLQTVAWNVVKTFYSWK